MPGPIQGPSQGPMVYPAPGIVREAAGKPAAATDRSQRLERACQDFESLFVQHLMQQMRRTVPEGDLFSGGRAEEMYTSMLDGEMAQSISRHRGMGLAAVLYRQLIERGEAGGQQDP